MVTRYGMSKKFGLVGLATVESQYLEGRTALNCSDATAAEIDDEVVAILKESYVPGQASRLRPHSPFPQAQAAPSPCGRSP